MSEFKELATQHANRTQFLSDFPHDFNSEISGFIAGAKHVKKEYEEKLRWIPIYEPPKTAELVIVDSDNDLHACVAVAFIENGIWKYANGQTLWFTPRRWRRFL